MIVKPFIATATGERALSFNNSITVGQKLRILVIPEENDDDLATPKEIELLNPVDQLVVKGSIPALKPNSIASLDVIIPENWIEGFYRINLRDQKTKALHASSFFPLKVASAFSKHLSLRALQPQWQLQYKLSVSNPTNNSIGNFSAFIAVPTTILPQQIVTKLVVHPSNFRLSSDVEGNNWLHMEVPHIAPSQSLELSYMAIIQRRPLLLSPHLALSSQPLTSPYTKNFLKSYLSSEPHLESNHPAIVELAKNILSDQPLVYIKRAVQVVNQIIRYEVQPEEFGAAYAIEQRKGDCTEFSALFVALCRAKGIPARVCAGFALGETWERHATAECMINGRWIPVDVTGQKNQPIILGSRTNTIILTRGNWMGGTLAQEVSYRYQIVEPNQTLNINVDWKINLLKETKSPILIKEKQSIRLLPHTARLLKQKVKILDSANYPQKGLKKQAKEKLIKVSNAQGHTKVATIKPVTIELSLPDIITNNQLKRSIIILCNTSEKIQRGCFEVRERDSFGVIRLLTIQGITLKPKSKRQLQLSIPVERKGLVTLAFLFLNRIGRPIEAKEKTISVF